MLLVNRLHRNYGVGMALVAGTGAIVFALLAAFGPEARDIRMTAAPPC
jgi:hypothetical protein